MLLTDLGVIKNLAAERENENDTFRVFLKNKNSNDIDALVQQLNDSITPKIDCTQCGNCCKSLMINITHPEAAALAVKLKMELPDLKKKYIEESHQGQLIMNTIPCHFLSGTKCSIYENRFTECRDFPHLHKDNFTDRLFGTLQHYGMCPIIFNVVEELKERIGFFITPK
jgi:Fe-S-cluster containining protein